MQRNKTSLSLILSIAAFAMLTMTQWLHSPLHHLAEAVEVSQPVEVAQHSCSHEHQHSHKHRDHTQHDHSQHQHAGHSHDQNCPGHQHPHPDDECEICIFVVRSVGNITDAVCLSGLESVEFNPDSVAVSVRITEQDHQLIRGPPDANS